MSIDQAICRRKGQRVGGLNEVPEDQTTCRNGIQHVESLVCVGYVVGLLKYSSRFFWIKLSWY